MTDISPRDLDRIVQFQRATSSDDGFSSVGTFENHGGPEWAKKTDASDSERWRAGEVAASITSRFVVHYSAFTAALTPKDRLQCEGVEYDISGIKEVGGRHLWFEITASARTDK